MPPSTYKELVEHILDLINTVVLFLFAFVFVYFIWKMIDSWIINSASETSREDGKKYLISAIISLVMMSSVWGIVNLIKSSFFG